MLNRIYKKYLKISSFLIILGLSLFLPFSLFAKNEYEGSQLDDINIFWKNFNGMPLVAICNTFNWTPLSDADLNNFLQNLAVNDYVHLKDTLTGANFIVHKSRFYQEMWRSLWAWYDFVVDVPKFTPTFEKMNKGHNLELLWKRTIAGTSDYVPFLLEGSTDYTWNNEYWLMYEANTNTPDNHFLPRKVLVDVYNGADQITSQVVDVFDGGKLSLSIPEALSMENVSLKKNRFYVIGETHEKAFWYFNWPIVHEILCPDKLSTSQNCQIRIIPQDNGDIKVKIKNKYTDEVYQTFNFPITRNRGVDFIEKDFFINLDLGYPDGDYVIVAESYKNGLMGQNVEKPLIIDRLPPMFDDLFPIVLIPIEHNGEYVATVKVSERLSEEQGEAMKEQGSSYITNVRKDDTNPLIYHLTINSANLRELKNIKMLLKDVSGNTQTSSLYVKRYTEHHHLGVNNIVNRPNGLNMDIDTFKDLAIDFDNPLVSWGGDIKGIEKFIDTNDVGIDPETQKTLLMGYNNNLNKIFPTRSKVREYPNNIKNISFNGINKYYIITDKNIAYANGLRAYSEKGVDLKFYNIYKNEYIIKYTDIALTIDGKKVIEEGSQPADDRVFPTNYKAFDILHWGFNSNNAIYVATYGGLDNHLRIYKIDLDAKTYKLINTIQTTDNNSYETVDLTLYNDKIVVLWKKNGSSRTQMAIYPFPMVEIVANEDNTIQYPASPSLEFDSLIYDKLDIKPLVKGSILPTMADCGSGSFLSIDWKTRQFDNNPYCNYEELQLKKDSNSWNPDINDYIFYDDAADTYTERTPAMIRIKKYWLSSEVGMQEIETQNKPTNYYIWLVKVDDIIGKATQIGKKYKNDSENWDMILYTKDQIKYLPEIVAYTWDEKKYIYKLNDKILTVNNRDDDYLIVVFYETKNWPSEIRIFNITTKVDNIVEPETWEYIPAERVLVKKYISIDTIRPIIYDVQSSDLIPAVWSKINLFFKTPEPIQILDMELGTDKVDFNNVQETLDNKIYQYSIKDVPVLESSYKQLVNKKVLRVYIKAKDKAENVIEKEILLEGEVGKVSTSSLSVGEIISNGKINVSDVLNTTDPNIANNDKIDVLTGKKLLNNQDLTVTLPRKDDGSIDFWKLFPWYWIIDMEKVLQRTNGVENYFFSYDKKSNIRDCNIYKDWNDYIIEWYCGFIRNKVYFFNGNVKIMNPLFYKWYTTIFSLWNVLINADILKEVEADKKEHLLWIINTWDITISWKVKTVQSLMKSEGTIVVKK